MNQKHPTTRRDFLKRSVAGGALAGLSGAPACRRAGGQLPPNILYLMTDQQSASASRVNGNRLVPSPFMEELARGGLVFADAYGPSPICTPIRTSIFTGVHPMVHQVTCHQNRAPYNLPQLQELLAKAGYYTAVAGHYESERNLARGWHEEVSHDDMGKIRKSLQFWTSHGRRDVGWSSGQLECAPEDGHAAALTSRALEMLPGIEAAKAPFFLHVPYLEPHPPYFVSPPYDTLVDPAAVSVPDPGSDEGRPAWHAKVREQSGAHSATEADVRRMIAVYYGMIAYADAQMKRLYDAMAARGLLANTWVICSSDHGDFVGEKGLFMKAESLYECLLHIPLLIRPPDGVDSPRGRRVAGFVDMVDLFPTLLGIAGIRAPEYIQGKDLMAWVRNGASEPLRDVVFAQVGEYRGQLKSTLPGGLAESARRAGLVEGARTREFNYIRDPDWGDEAYDLRSDPKELRNVLGGGRPEPSEVAALRRRADEWRQTCLDLRKSLGIVPGYRGFDGET
jgi:arylsulfatase A-like enzyme